MDWKIGGTVAEQRYYGTLNEGIQKKSSYVEKV